MNAKTLLAAVNARGQAIDYLLANVQQVSAQFQGLVNDNPNLNHVLEQLRTVTDLLVKHKYDLADVLMTLSKFTASLAEAVGSGPYFKVLLVNLLPGQALQPFIDAAFKKRGIDPEQFWRNAGLPAFQFPDPNGSASPMVRRRRRRRCWRARRIIPGPRCPRVRRARTPRRPTAAVAGNPLPCADLTVGPVRRQPVRTELRWRA